MPWNLRRDFHLDINAAYGSCLLVSANDSLIKQPPPDMISGDGMPVRIYFWERATDGTLTAADPGSESTLIFSGRPAAAPAGSSILFLTTDFLQISPGVWEGTLNLATAEFAAHIAAAPAGSKIILGEIEVRNASNTARTSIQFDLTARPQVYANDATPLALPTPAEWLIGPGAPVNAVTGVCQIETTTVIAPSGCTFSGTLIVTVVLVDNSGPLSIGVPLTVASHTTAALIASAIRAAMAAHPTLGARFTVSGSGADIVLTRRIAVANDSTLNIVIPGVIGLTAALTSTNTTAGAAEVIASTAPPYLRVSDGFLYVQQDGTWKKAALSDL